MDWNKLRGSGADSNKKLIKKYQSIEMRQLLVKAELGKNYAPNADETIHLDAILSYAIIQDIRHAMPSNNDNPFVYPLPLQLLWVNSKGLPLWAASCLMPDGDASKSSDYWHKRHPSRESVQFCAKPSVPTTRGSFKEYRTPIRVVTTDSLSGLCVGNKEEVQRLLNKVEFLGKKGSQGRGYVVSWDVSEMDLDNEAAISKIMRNRPVPIKYIEFLGADISTVRTRNIGWTPPYWHHTRFADCVVC